MKKVSLFFLFLILYSVARAQTDTNTEKPNIDRVIGKNEIKLNFLYTFVEFYDDSKNLSIHIPEIQYERKLTNNVGAGLSFWTSGTNELKYLIIPHLRIYFGLKNNNFLLN